MNYKIDQNRMFILVKGLKTDSKEVEGGRCMRGSDGKLYFSEKERCKVWKDYMEWIMNEENDWDHNVEGDAVEGPVVCVSRMEVLQTLNENKKSPWHIRSITGVDCCLRGNKNLSEVEMCERVLDGFGISVEWAFCIVVPIFKGKGAIRNSSCHRAVKHLEHGMKVVERVLEKRLFRIKSADEIQFGFMPG